MSSHHRLCSQPHHHVPAGALLRGRAAGGRASPWASSSWCRPIPTALAFSLRAHHRGVLGHEPVFRAHPARAGEYGIGLYHRAHPGADPAAGHRRRPLASAGWCWPSVVAIASKFVLAIGRKHIFNPVAIGVAASALLLDQPATWWVGGNLTLLPFVLVGGLLVVRKLQRFDMVGDLYPRQSRRHPRHHVAGDVRRGVHAVAALFAAAVCRLRHADRAADGAAGQRAAARLRGHRRRALARPTFTSGVSISRRKSPFSSATLFAYAVSPKGRFKLTLVRIEKMTSGCYDFVFKPDRKLDFQTRAISRLDARRAQPGRSRQPPYVHHRLGAERRARSALA